jgi:hypothetical protein
MTACGQGPESAQLATAESEKPTGEARTLLNTTPASLEEARETVLRIDDRLRANANDKDALLAISAIQPRLDALNHLVARVAPKPGHTVSFFETGNGSVVIKEAAPQGEASVLGATDVGDGSLVSIYRKLSGGAEPPEALVNAESHRNVGQRDDKVPGAPQGQWISTEDRIRSTPQLNLDFGPGDGQLFANNYCYKGGDFHACQPNWWNGGWWNFNTKTSFMQMAPVYGGMLWVQYQYNGSFGFLDPVYQGQYWTAWAWSSSYAGGSPNPYDFNIGNHAWTLIGAQGREFDWSFEARWTCIYWGCESAQ